MFIDSSVSSRLPVGCKLHLNLSHVYCLTGLRHLTVFQRWHSKSTKFKTAKQQLISFPLCVCKSKSKVNPSNKKKMTRTRRSSSASIQAAVSTLPKSKKRTVTERSPAVKSRKERKTDELQSPTNEVQDKENVTPSKNSMLEDVPRATPYWKVSCQKIKC